MTVDGVGACSCRIATHAMCASVCATRLSASLSSPGSEPNRPSAPSTMPAARIGTACTEAKPASSAAGTNRGHRAAAALGRQPRPVVRWRSSPRTGLRRPAVGTVPVRGPARWWRPTAGVGRAGRREGSRRTPRRAARHCAGEFGEQVDDVEVLEEGVDEGDDRVQHAGLTRGFGHTTPSLVCINASSLSLRSRMSRATSVALRPVEYAWARRRTRASAGSISS